MCSIGVDIDSSPTPVSRCSPSAGQPRTPSANLTRFAPDRRHWVLYETAQENDFLSWWLETEYGQQLTKNGQYNFRWSTESRSSKVWRHFDQVAEVGSGRPKVVCRSCLAPLNHPHHPHHKSHGTSTMGKHLKSTSCRRSKEKVAVSAVTSGPIQVARAGSVPPRSRFDQAQLKDQLLRTITTANLSFGVTEEPTFKELLNLVYAGPHGLELPSSKQLRQHMHDVASSYQESQLQDLPGDSKVSIALCCWKSSLGQDCLAMIAYYFDTEWRYREALLGLEMLCRNETGTDPGDQILALIRKKGLLRRIFSVIIDYRVDANLALSLQEKLVSSGGISHLQCFFGVPGTVQAIQLSLRHFSENITNLPEKVQNVRAISHVNGWTDPSNGDEIMIVLEKIRSFAKYVNETNQKRNAFLSLQSSLVRLLPLDDAEDGWKSLFLMLKRASSLRKFIDQYCYESGNLQHKLTDNDWRKVDYLVQLITPFIEFTTALLASKEATVHNVSFVFKALMKHIDESAGILRRKSAPWKRTLLKAFLRLRMELAEVYENTFQKFEVMYGTGTFVAPQYKVSAFDDATSSQGLGSAGRYIELLRIFHLQYSPQMPTSLSCANGLSCSPQLLGLERLLHPLAGPFHSSRGEPDEVDQYLQEGAVNISPCSYWKDRQHEWPVLSRLARDLLSIPATGAGTERLFTVIEYVHARGGYLDDSAMQDWVMYVYSQGSEKGHILVDRLDHDTADEEWGHFEVETHRPSPISDDEWDSVQEDICEPSGDDENSEVDTVILEDSPMDADAREESSFLLQPVTWFINSVRRRFSNRITVT
ncbi:uncharacterized protein N7511_001761 [Penicillium nucicola]|nr:uncharacterized protein N7511_011385 [Penicillium nucicola]XP_056978719.1 uncharacterized protein N7511_011224 [Penicillium nucicola]XP_056989919.1 uncharacterized protein N7511_001761 [Penicillium nucicola]KAJ5742366.1 hypothetical protein N7511_011385 [Penicillium nucicola]KAJ5742653.1 hypothetical protein N7511_011224 [Penicillium nucicola]KAJ5776750.1 hypothetical protein N7511_001761 [Penicillium nucicola]